MFLLPPYMPLFYILLLNAVSNQAMENKNTVSPDLSFLSLPQTSERRLYPCPPYSLSAPKTMSFCHPDVVKTTALFMVHIVG